MLFLLAVTAAFTAGYPSGDRLHPYRACYVIVSGSSEGAERISGATLQTLSRERVGNRSIWRVVVHQRTSDGRFDMRDDFLLDGHTLEPLSLESRRGGKPHVHLTFTRGHVAGERWDARGTSTVVEADLPHIWIGDLYGPTFASLPLKLGATFSVPYYQYDRGIGNFTIAVTGSRTVKTGKRIVKAWVLDAGPDAASRFEYLISKVDRRELGYTAPQGGERLGGDCSGLD